MSYTARQARLLAAALDQIRKEAFGHFTRSIGAGADEVETYDQLIRDREALDDMQERFGVNASLEAERARLWAAYKHDMTGPLADDPAEARARFCRGMH